MQAVPVRNRTSLDTSQAVIPPCPSCLKLMVPTGSDAARPAPSHHASRRFARGARRPCGRRSGGLGDRAEERGLPAAARRGALGRRRRRRGNTRLLHEVLRLCARRERLAAWVGRDRDVRLVWQLLDRAGRDQLARDVHALRRAVHELRQPRRDAGHGDHGDLHGRDGAEADWSWMPRLLVGRLESARRVRRGDPERPYIFSVSHSAPATERSCFSRQST